MRKLIAGLSILSLFLQGMSLVTDQANSLNTVPITTPKVASLQDHAKVMVNFADITQQNAGQEIAKWKGKESFVKSFVLPEGFSLNLNEEVLQNAFSGSTKLKRDFDNEKRKGIALGTMEEGDMELTQYPDRITVSKKLLLKMENALEYSNYRRKFWDFIQDKEQEKLETQMLDELVPKCKLDSDCSAWLKTDAQIREKVTKDLVGKQEIEMIDQADFSLIPLDLDTGSGQRQLDIGLEPKDVRISSAEIMGRFARLKSLQAPAIAEQLANSDVKFDLGLQGETIQAPESITENETEEQMNNRIRQYEELRRRQLEEQERRLSEQQRKERRANAMAREQSRLAALPPLERRCQTSYITTEPLYEECMRIGRSIAEWSTSTANKTFVNGFTRGASFSHKWEVIKRVPWYGAVFRARATINIGYGVGVRLPFEFSVRSPDTKVFEGDHPRIAVQIKAQPKDLNAEQYSALGLPNDKLYEGKEFVLKLWADATVKVVVAWHTVFERENLDLLSLIGLERINESKDFTPKIDNSRMPLLSHNFEIPVLDMHVITLNATIGLAGSVKGRLSGACRTTDLPNSNACDSRFTIRQANAWQSLPSVSPSWRGRFGSSFSNSAYGPSHAFWIDFNEFEIQTSIVIDVLAGGTVRGRVPHLGSRTWHIGPWNVYSFDYSDGYTFETHRGTSGSMGVTLGRLYASELPPKSAAKLRHEEMLGRNLDIIDALNKTKTTDVELDEPFTATGMTVDLSRLSEEEDDSSITNFLVWKGLIHEQPKLNDYRLDSTISRGEMAKLMGGIYNDFLSDDIQFSDCTGKVFSDVKKDSFCPYIEILAEKWLLSKTNRTFRTNDPVSRAEFMTMLLRSAGKSPISPIIPQFRDIPEKSAHAGYIAYALQEKLYLPASWTNFRPDLPATRREVFLFIKRLIDSKSL